MKKFITHATVALEVLRSAKGRNFLSFYRTLIVLYEL